jgi:phosphoglycolate phosphatase-like HAD superfamily hydrolase
MAVAIWLTYKLPWFKCKEYGEKIIELGAKMVSKEDLLNPLPYAVQAINFFSKFAPICIATSDSKENTIEMVEYLNIRDKIKCIVTSDEVEKGKPEADILLKISEILNIEPSKLLLVGDNEIDVETARRAGAKSTIIGEKDLGADGWVRNFLEFIELNKEK